MNSSRFECHNHTRFSNLRLRDALPTPEQLIDKAIEIGLKGICITEHDSVSSHIKANKYAQKIKEKYPDFKVGLGNEIYLVDERPSTEHYHFILIAKDAIGHKQLRRLSSIAWLNSYNTKGMTRVDTLKSDVEMVIGQNKGHLIASSACLGSQLDKMILKMEMARQTFDIHTVNEMHDEIIKFILWCEEMFPNDFYLECQPVMDNDQFIVNKKIKELAKVFNLKVICTSDTHYLRPEDRTVHKAFLNSENKEREVDAFYKDAYLHTNEEMLEKLGAEDGSAFDEDYIKWMFQNSLEIAEKIEDYSLLHTPEIPKVEVDFFPKMQPPQELSKHEKLCEMYVDDDKVNRYWVNTCINKLIEINKFNEEYLEELEEEAEVKSIIGKKLNTNMFQYPITLAHYIDLFWECGSTVGVGRGSAAAALNHYLLGICQLDPVEWKLPFFRYMNRERVELGDVDLDLNPFKIQKIIKAIRKERRENFSDDLTELEKRSLGATFVCTFGTESSKSSITTACRGYRSEEYPEGIDSDIAQYLSSLIPVERGFVWNLHDVYYGNEDKKRKRVSAFKREIDKYPGLLEIALGIEGNISRRGRHASGVILANEDPYKYNAFMKTPKGEIVTQYDLHDAEEAGSQKFDFLTTSVQAKISQTLEFLQKEKLIDPSLSLKDAYNKYLHPDNLPIEDELTWKTVQNAESLDLFQFDSPVGRQGAKKVKPSNILELSSTNGLIRLMTQEPGQETWIDKYVRFKNNPSLINMEMGKFNLTKEEKEVFMKYVGDNYGIGIDQECLMKSLMDKNICDFSLAEANQARKIVAKKKMSEIPAFENKIFERAKNNNVARYLWNYIVAVQLGYSFSVIHSLSYSFISFQTAYLATHWNPIYWNTACLLVNSDSLEEEEEDDNENEDSKKNKSTNYEKIAKALGNIISNGIKVSLVDINNSDFGFKPDVKNNQILFGMNAVNRLGAPIIEKIIENRPYQSFNDFMARCPLNKTQMFSLIKAGAFDKLEEEWAQELGIEPRVLIMVYYISKVCEPKKRLTLQNFNALIEKNLLPKGEKNWQRIFAFNKYLKKCKYKDYYYLNEVCEEFYRKSEYDETKLIVTDGNIFILQKDWDKMYKKEMEIAKAWLNDNQEELLQKFNELLFAEMWDKYASENVSAWEMESLCFYYHDHELKNVNMANYGIVNYFDLPEKPVLALSFTKENKTILLYELHKIIGTVIAKDDTRSSVAILTTDGVVNVKFNKEYYAMYNRQISEIQENGTKKIVEKGWFTRGTKIMVQGFRREDTFVAKRYKNTSGHTLYKIEGVDSKGYLILTHERYKGEEDEEI